MDQHAVEVREGRRFAFGLNWRQFLRAVDDQKIGLAQRSLSENVGDLNRKAFLDVGSGSGLFSLAARRLGARVCSFDYDPYSVGCAQELRDRFFSEDQDWTIERGSVLDAGFVEKLGTYDVVYAWGVLHHTGAMWTALANLPPLVRPGGRLFIAIYNDQRLVSRYWAFIKKQYCRSFFFRACIILAHLPYPFLVRAAIRLGAKRFRLERGMTLWRDYIDWLGGYPFEVATPEAVFSFFKQRGFVLERLKTCGGRSGCNEFVFARALEPQS